MKQEVSTGIPRRGYRPAEVGPVRPNFVLTCPDCEYSTGLLTLHPSWRCASCRVQWQLKMCRHCHRHLAMGEDGSFCQGVRCRAGRTAIASS
jgi:hypothetical protein